MKKIKINKINNKIIYPPGELKIKPAKTIFDINHLSFSINKNKWGDTTVARIKNGAASWRKAYTEKNELIDINYFIKPKNKETKNPKKIKGTVALLNNTDYSYHSWLLNELPRIHLYNKSKWKYDWIYTLNHKKYQQEALSILGIQSEKVISFRDYPYIKADNLLLSQYDVNKKIPWACNYIRKNFLKKCIKNNNKKFPERIYLSREDCSARKIKNEKELVDFLKKHKFHKVKTEEFSLKDQVILFNQAKIIIAPHGAALGNIIFCKPNTKIIEIFGKNKIFNFSLYISSIYKLDYYYLIQSSDSGISFINNINKKKYLPDDEYINVSINDLKIIFKKTNII